MTDFMTVHLSAAASRLVEACGGLIAAALECDVSKTQLQRATDPNNPYTLKASTIYHLEQACGQSIMSLALLDLQAGVSREDRCPVWLGIDLAHGATSLNVAIVNANADGTISPREQITLAGMTSDLRSRLARLGKAYCDPAETVSA